MKIGENKGSKNVAGLSLIFSVLGLVTIYGAVLYNVLKLVSDDPTEDEKDEDNRE